MRHSESVLLAHLTEPDSLDALAREGFGTAEIREVIPTDLIRRILSWSIDRFFADGRTVAPSREAIVEYWGDKLEALQIEMPDTEIETDSIGFVIEDLRNNHARIMAEKWTTDFAKDIATCDPSERAKIFGQYAQTMFHTAQQLVSRKNEMDGDAGLEAALTRLMEREASGHVTQGMTFGIPILDNHMFGTHPGEITTVCAESGVGKSWWAAMCCLNEWRQGRRHVLFTLENSIEMTYDRLACIGTGIDYDRWQRGEVRQDEKLLVLTMLEQLQDSPKKPLIISPDPSQRTPSGLVRKAFLEEADSMGVDQLQYVRPDAHTKATQRNFQVVDIMQGFHELIGESSFKIPMHLLVQINREGAKAARKINRYYKEHLAESSAVEQASDFVWAIYQSSDMKREGTVQFQCLKARRVPEKHFELEWYPEIGYVEGIGEVNMAEQEQAA